MWVITRCEYKHIEYSYTTHYVEGIVEWQWYTEYVTRAFIALYFLLVYSANSGTCIYVLLLQFISSLISFAFFHSRNILTIFFSVTSILLSYFIRSIFYGFSWLYLWNLSSAQSFVRETKKFQFSFVLIWKQTLTNIFIRFHILFKLLHPHFVYCINVAIYSHIV